MTTSAEQLAIALMAEARRLNTRVLGPLDQAETADRLAQWANDVRQLGVELVKYRGSYVTEKDINVVLQREAEEVRAKLARVRELVSRIEPFDHGVLVSAQVRDILEVIDG